MTGVIGGTWTIANLGDPTPLNWDIRAAGSFTDLPTLTGDGSPFMGANSDLAGGSTHLNTILSSPSFSTVGLASANLTFNQYCFSQLPYDAKVNIEYSVDGGSSWAVLVDFLGTTTSTPVGSLTWSASSPTQTVPLPPAAIGQPDVMLRWSYSSTFGWYWAIDNVVVAGSTDPAYTWAGIGGATGLSCTACSTPLITPAAGGANVYSVTATYGSCSITSGVAINVNPGSVTGTLSGPVQVCPGSTIALTAGTTGGTWSSSNTTVAAVDGTGTVTGVSAGNAIISYSVPGSCGPLSSLGLVTVGQPVLTTVVGSGASGFLGDGGPATAARINSPTHISVDPNGNMYIADYNNNVVRKVTPAGIITTVAGVGSIAGYNSDNIAATTAYLNHPGDAIADAAGNIYIADRLGNRVRKVSPSGIITTIAGGAAVGYTGDNGPASAARVSAPNALALDVAGNLYFSDFGNSVIRKISTTGIITTVVGTGVSGMTGDGLAATMATIRQTNGIAVDKLGNIYMADGADNVIRKVDASGIISRFAGTLTGGFSGDNGPALSANINQPTDVKVDVAGNVYIADNTNQRLRRVNTAGIISTLAGLGFGGYSGEGVPANLSTLNSPNNCYVDDNGVLYITSVLSQRVQKYSPIGINIVAPATTICQGASILFTDPTPGGTWSSSDPSVAAVGSSIGIVTGITAGTANITYTFAFSCGLPQVIQAVTVNAFDAGTITGPAVLCSGNTITLTDAAAGGVWTSSNTAVATVSGGTVTGVAAGNATISYTVSSGPCGTRAATQQLVVGEPRITSFAGTGGVGSAGDGGPATAATFNTVHSVCQDLAGNVYIGDAGNHKIRKVTPAGIVSTFAGTGTNGSTGDGFAATSATLMSPFSITTDVAGNVYFADNTGNRVRKINTSGIISTIAGTGVIGFSGDGGPATAATFNSPCGVSFDAAGNLYIGDGGNRRIRKISPAGIITSIAGSGGFGSAGDGGPATAATFNNPNYVHSDAAGNVYIADNGNHKIRKVSNLGLITTVAGNGTPGSLGLGGPATAAQLDFPGGIAMDGAGNFYIAGDVSQDIRMVNTSGIISLYAGTPFVSGFAGDNGPPTAAKFSIPVDVTVDNNGDLLIADQTNNIVRKIFAAPASVAPITGPSSVCQGSAISLADVTTGGTWSSSLPAIATVGTSGVVSGLSPGVTDITYSRTYTCGTITVTQSVTVNALPATPGPITGPANLCFGAALTLTDGVAGGTWSSTVPAVATVGSSSGIVTSVSAGATVFSYTQTTACGSAGVALTVNVLPAPVAISGTANLCTGTATTLTDIGSGTWSSSNTAVATIGTSTGVVNAIAPGNTTITYTLSGICSTTTIVTVNPTPAAITPAAASSFCVGATATLANSAPGGTWSSANGLIATVGTSGVVTGASAGMVNISYTLTGGCSATKPVTVLVTPTALSPSATVVCTGATTTLSETVGGGIWTSTAPTIASVAGGVVSGVAVGNATISYTIGTCAVGATVTVNLSPAAGSITGPSTLCTGVPATFTDAAPGGTWASSIPGVLAVSPTGDATALAAGVVTVSYAVTNSCGTATASKLVTVSVTASAGSIIGTTLVCAGNTTAYIDTTAGGSWAVTNANATISPTGIFSALVPGIDTVTYSVTNGCGTVSTRKIVTIGLPLTAGAISGPASVCVGSSVTLTDPAPSGSWTSSNASAAVSGGIVTGLTAGTDTISYTVTSGCGTVAATHIITVVPVPFAGSITGPVITCAGMTASYTDAAPGGVWAMTNALAAISTSGDVTTTTPGIDTVTYTVSNSCGADVASLYLTIGAPIAAGSVSGPSLVCTGASITLTDPVAGGSWSASNGHASVAGGIVTGITAGVDTILYTISSTCGAVSALSTVTVSPLPVAGAISGPATLCIGTAVTYTDPASGGVWSSSNSTASVTSGGLVTPLSSGTDTISYTVTNGCGTAAATRIVAIGIAPSVAAISGSGHVCTAGATSLSDATPGGVWTASNGNATVVGGLVTGLAIGMDTIAYTLTSGCGAVAAKLVVTIDGTPVPAVISGPGAVCVGSPITLADATPGGIWTATNGSATISPSGIVTAVAAGIDTVMYTITNACGSAAASHIVAVSIGAPSAGAITGPATVCAASFMTLADAAPGGTWSSSNATATVAGGIVSGITPGTDTIIYTVTNSCGTATATYEITVGAALVTGTITGPASLCVGASATLIDPVSGGIWSSSNGTATVAGGVVTGIAPGVDTIAYTVSGACGTASATHILTVGIAPVVGTVTGPSSACVGAAITMSASVPGGVWSVSNSHASVAAGIVTGLSAGTDTILYTVTSSCGTAVASRPVVISAAPSAGTIAGSGSLCPAATVTLSHTGAPGTWSSSNTAVATVSGSGLVTGIASGFAVVSYTVSGACGHASATHSISVLTPSACEGVIVTTLPAAANEELRVSPNPNNGAFTMSVQSGISEEVSVIITNVLGEKVREFRTTTNKVEDLQLGTAPGIYLLTASTAHSRHVAKVIIN